MNAQLFVASTVTQTKDISTLVAGELAIHAMNSNTGRIENGNPLLVCDQFMVSVGKPSGSIVSSRDIDSITNTGKGVMKRNLIMKKMQYREPVKQVVLLTTDYLGKSSYDEFSVRISVRGAYDGYFGVEQFFKTYSATGRFATQRALYDAIAKDANSDENIFVDSVVSTDAGVQITFKLNYQGYVAFVIDRGDDGCDPCEEVETEVQVLNEVDFGSGTPDFISKLASQWSYWNGGNYTLNRLFPVTETDQVLDMVAGKYDMYYTRWTNNSQINESQTEAAFNVYQDLMVVVPKDTDMSYYMQTLEALIGSKFKATPSYLL